VVRVAPHPIFHRKGNDLALTVPITFPEATLGADISVPTLDGSSVTVRIPAGTRSGRTFRVKGKGVTTKSGTGSLLATVEVAVPAKLSSAERKALEAYRAASNGASPREHLGV
jgi:molecular chaperone DnaJ